MKQNNCHIGDIKRIFPDAVEIYHPAVMGMIRDVYIVKNNDSNKFICRFENEMTAKHNLHVSQLLVQHEIPVPDIHIHKCNNGEFCETYTFIEGKTLHERLVEGLNGEKLDEVFRQVFHIAYKISLIPYDDITWHPVPITTRCILGLFNMLNPKSKELCHCDLYAKNIILDENDNVRAFVDLDSVSNISLRFSFMVTIRDAHLYGYDMKKLEKLAAEYNQPYSKIGVDKQLKLYYGIRRVFRFFVREGLRKQLLKIKVK